MTPRKLPPIADITEAPLVCDIGWTARILNRSIRAIETDLAAGVMVPPPMPVVGHTVNGRGRKKHPRQWSRAALEAHLNGGYLQFAQAARPTRTEKKPRRYFGAAKAAMVAGGAR